MDIIGNHAMQKTALREIYKRSINIVPASERVGAENSVAVMAMLINRVLAIGMMRPYGIGQILQLRLGGPVPHSFAVFLVVAHHFLQKYQVRFAVAKLGTNV